LVDSGFDSTKSALLLDYGWNLNSLMIGAVFSFSGEIENPWEAKIRGAKILCGPRLKENIEQLLNQLVILEKAPAGSVLLIDDLDSPRFIMSSFIEAMGLGPVFAVSNSLHALEKLREDPDRYYAVVSDINMPDLNGIEFVSIVRADPKIREIPVIMLTAYATSDNLIDSLRAGATGFIVKPPQKKVVRRELEKARRLRLMKQAARLCKPEEADILEVYLMQHTSL